MSNNFDFFSLSIFTYSEMPIFLQAVKDTFFSDFAAGRAILFADKLQVEKYYSPEVGGNHDDCFSFWKTLKYPNKIFLSSNSADGRFTLCNVLHLKLNCDFVLCRMSGNIEYPLYDFEYTSASNERRSILAYKDPKWVFYESGKPLSFEDLNLYKNRLIKKRLNNDIIKQYLLQMGVIFEEIGVNVSESYTCIRKIQGKKHV